VRRSPLRELFTGKSTFSMHRANGTRCGLSNPADTQLVAHLGWHCRFRQGSIPAQRKGPVTPSLRFLVVDDDADGRFLTRHHLQRRFPRCDVIETATSDEAVTAAGRHRFDAIVTDHHLGDPDGAMLLQRLRALDLKCPMIMVTNSSDPKVRNRALAAGASEVFAPGDMDFATYLRSVLPPN